MEKIKFLILAFIFLKASSFVESKVYEVEAETGDGLTRLARKAIFSYIKEQGININVQPVHLLFSEDYLARKKGDKFLLIGDKLNFTS